MPRGPLRVGASARTLSGVPAKYDVVVIGSGLGGSTVAALLASFGKKTLLLEKNPRLGGSCS